MDSLLYKKLFGVASHSSPTTIGMQVGFGMGGLQTWNTAQPGTTDGDNHTRKSRIKHYHVGQIAMNDNFTSRWCCPTPDRFLGSILAVVGVLFLSNCFRWFSFNEHKGYTVLIAVTAVGMSLFLMVLWYLLALLFRLRFQFSSRSLLILVVVVAVPCSWFATEMRDAKSQQRRIRLLAEVGTSMGRGSQCSTH